MAAIISDDSLVELKIRELLALVEANSASLHPEMLIVSSQNELHIETKLEPSNTDPIMHIPDACLPKIDDFHINLEGSEMVLEPRSDNISRLHTDILEKILELFNLTEKITTHKKTFPMIALADNKDILEHLNKGTLTADLYYTHLKEDNFDHLIKSSFFGARYIRHDYQDGNKKRGAIMPVIDFLNHHGLASTYLQASTEPEINEGRMVRHSRPLQGSDECFVCYNKLDPLSAYMYYGFVDMNAPALRSIPLTLSVRGAGKIQVDADVYNDDVTNLPPEHHDIKYYFPYIKNVEKNNAHLSHLMIPSDGNPAPLRRVLQFFISVISPNMQKKALKKLVRETEEQVLRKNINYYVKLKELLESAVSETGDSEKFKNLSQLIQHQQKSLLTYRKRNL
jgi:hypothetical protein